MTDLWEPPRGWRWATMGEVATIVGGSTPKTSEPSYWGGNVPWITPDDLSGFTGKYIERGRRSITQAGYDSCSTQMVPAGTVLFTSRAPIGYVAIAANPVCTNQGFKSFVAGPELEPDYLYWYLRASTNLARSMASGTTFLELSGKAAARIPIPVPPIEEQQRMVERIEEQLARLTSGSASLNAVLARLLRTHQAIIDSAVRSEAWQATATSRDGLPPAWGWASTAEIAGRAKYAMAIGPFGSNLKVADYRPSGVPVVFVRNVRSGEFLDGRTKYVSHAKAAELAPHHVQSGDVLITKMGDPPGDATVYAEGMPPAVITADIIKLSVDDQVADPRFVALAINSSPGKAQVLAITQGVAQRKVSLGRFKTVHIPVPPLAEQRLIVAEAEAQMSRHRAIEHQIRVALRRADVLQQAILRAAQTGHLHGEHA
jgi:type I restriction enzyme S subunit